MQKSFTKHLLNLKVILKTEKPHTYGYDINSGVTPQCDKLYIACNMYDPIKYPTCCTYLHKHTIYLHKYNLCLIGAQFLRK